jgi:predicted dehydrogenase
MTHPLDRRAFIQTTTAGIAGILASGTAPSLTARGAGEKISIGCIGTGGRCRHLMTTLQRIEQARIVAVCDIYDEKIRLGAELAEEGAFTTREYERLLERKDIDAVLIGTPDHWHVPISIDACEAGKDVYVEKPLTHDPSEGPKILEAQERTGRVVQVGMQQRSMPHIQEAVEILKSGKLGKIHKVHLSWNRNQPRAGSRTSEIDPSHLDWKRFLGNAPDQPFDEYRYRHWRWFWDFGGGIFTDLMVHWIDVAHWLMDSAPPTEAASSGQFYLAEGLWETPDTVQTLLYYPDKGYQAHFEGTFINARFGAMIEFLGTEANLYIDRGRYEVVPERDSKVKPEEKILGTGPKGQDFYDTPDGELLHLTNWLDCIRSRQEPTAPVSAGVAGAAAAHLANTALRTRTTATRQG